MEHQPQETLSEPINKKAVIAGMILSVAILFVPGFLLRPIKMDPISRMYWLELARWFEVGLMYLYARKIEKMTFTWDQSKESVWFYMKETTVVYALSWLAGLLALVSLLFVKHDNMEVLNRMTALITPHIGLLIFTCITAGVTEEMLFRAYLVPRLGLFFAKNWPPVVVSALIFSALHFGYFNLHEIIFTFFIGVVMAWHYQRYQNIYVLMAAHFLIDFGSFMMTRYHSAPGMAKLTAVIVLVMMLVLVANFAPVRSNDDEQPPA